MMSLCILRFVLRFLLMINGKFIINLNAVQYSMRINTTCRIGCPHLDYIRAFHLKCFIKNSFYVQINILLLTLLYLLKIIPFIKSTLNIKHFTIVKTSINFLSLSFTKLLRKNKIFFSLNL